MEIAAGHGFRRGHNNPANRAAALLESMLDGNGALAMLEVDAMVSNVSPESIKARFATAYAPVSQLIFVAISADASALPGACVIAQPKDVLACP